MGKFINLSFAAFFIMLAFMAAVAVLQGHYYHCFSFGISVIMVIINIMEAKKYDQTRPF